MSAVLTAILAISLGAAPPIRTAYDAQSGTVVVPRVDAQAVKLDGTFSPGEWDGAVRFRISADLDLYLAADDVSLRVGLKYAAPAEFRMADLFFSTNPKEFQYVHASAALGEARMAFPSGRPSRALELRHVDWDANFLDESAAPVKVEGNEFRILRKVLAGDRLRFAIQLKDRVFYPAAANLRSADGWVELVLPPIKTAVGMR